MNLRDRWRQWRRGARFRRELARVNSTGLRAPVREIDVDPETIRSYAELVEARTTLQRATASMIEPFQDRVAQYPVVGSSKVLAIQGFRKNPVVRRCGDLICESATQARIVVEDESGADASGPVADSIRSLLEQPTGVYTGTGAERTAGPMIGADLMWQLYQDLYITSGNALWEWFPGLGTSEPVQIWRMDPSRVGIEASTETWIGSYLYRLGGEWFRIPPERVIHWRIWDPCSDFFGVPPLYSALRMLATDNELQDFFKVTIQNMGVPPLVLEYEPDHIAKAGLSLVPDQEQISEIRNKFWEAVGGVNRGKAAVAWGYKIKVIGLDMQKMAIGDLIATSESRIAMVFGVPMILIGKSGTQGDPTRANFQTAREHFFTTVIASITKRVGDILTARLIPAYGAQGSGLRIRLDLSHVDVLREARLRRAGEAATVFLAGLASRAVCQDLAGIQRHGPDSIYRPDSVGMAIEATATEEPQIIEEVLS